MRNERKGDLQSSPKLIASYYKTRNIRKLINRILEKTEGNKLRISSLKYDPLSIRLFVNSRAIFEGDSSIKLLKN